MNLQHDFFYYERPRITLAIGLASSPDRVVATALIDTGSDQSLFDTEIADILGVDLSRSPTLLVWGVGGEIREAKLAPVRLELLERLELSVLVELAFTSEVEAIGENILVLDVLELFDLAVSHSKRLGYIGVTDP